MNIMLFGGGFDPPHLGHLTIARTVIASKIAQEVWYVPCFLHPFHKKVSSAQHRLEMLSFMTEDHIKIEDFELSRHKPSYSIDTLEALSKKYPQHKYSWIIGSDNVEKFHKWHRYEELLSKYDVYVYPRAGFSTKNADPKMKILADIDEVVVSSTQIRNAVAQNTDISELVLPEIQEYIKTHSLYN